MTRRKHPRINGIRANANLHELLRVGLTWFPDAACAGTQTPDLWFAHDKSEPDLVKLAKTICNDCPAQQRCLEYALNEDIDHGIWGGQTAQERKTIRRKKWRPGTGAVKRNPTP